MLLQIYLEFWFSRSQKTIISLQNREHSKCLCWYYHSLDTIDFQSLANNTNSRVLLLELKRKGALFLFNYRFNNLKFIWSKIIRLLHMAVDTRVSEYTLFPLVYLDSALRCEYSITSD